VHSIANSSLYTYEYAINFRYFLEGRQFIAFSEHEPLTFCMSKVSGPWSNRQQRQLSYISEFTTDIGHVDIGIFFCALAKDQQDPEKQAFRTARSSHQVGTSLWD
jgi:hypothetical protein